MKLGIFSPEISAKTIPELFEKIKKYGFSEVQFDFLSVCEEEMPDEIPEALIETIYGLAQKNNIDIVAVNGTFNMAHPDVDIRKEGIKRLETIAAASNKLSCKLITLCTGTRNRTSMWVPHKDNGTKEAWQDMTAVMEQALKIAEKYDVILGLETEASNIVNSPEKARRLIDEMKSSRLKVIMDCANLFREGMAKKELVRPVIKEAFDLLGNEVVLAHGKDILETPGIEFTGAGKGIVDFEYFFSELAKVGYRGGIILHGIKKESDLPSCVEYIKKKAELFPSLGHK